jgi:class 3 adenylate cyclase/tetratricopeptide (TPR) repeat protein
LGMVACSSCGSQILETATFCPTCGVPVLRPCPSCGSPVARSARFCPTCGTDLGPGGPVREEERKLVTILFADVTGSTSLGERLDPERLRSLLSAYFSAMSALIESWGGTVEKFIGDAIMAVFGVPIVREDDPERAIRASLDMLSRLEELNRDFEDRHGVTLQIRIGVNTGEVIAPVSGPLEQMIVSGDAVNVAARLEQSAEPGTILVGERTYLAARNAFRFEPPVALDLKGKAEAVRAWRVIEPLPEATRGVPGLRSVMVGRDRELDALVTLLEEAVETGRPRMVAVYGPAGIGKSRLVREFLRIASSKYPDLGELRGRCLAAGHGITYWALGEILRGATGIGLADSAELAGEKLRQGVRGVLASSALSDPDIEQTMFALAVTAGIQLPENPLDAMEPRSVAVELSRAWPQFATAYASRRAAAFVVEDLHWAEDQLLDMLERLLARSSGSLLFVVTARPEFAEAHPRFASGREDVSSVSLRPLTEQQSAELVEGLLAVADLPHGLREEILSKAEGNPFFLEEIIRRLIDEGALVREGNRWRATEAAQGLVLPDSVHGLLAARIDGLPREEKRVLQEAAVVGRVFWEEPVARAIGNGAVSDALLQLERRGLVFARTTSTIAGQVEFMFKHALVRDVAYASLPKTRRARAHAEHAAWIEELAGGRVDEFAELIAHHYRTASAGEDADLAWADDPLARDVIQAKAFAALLRAGALARKRFAIAKAVELHEQAVALASKDLDRARALEEVGSDHAASFRGDEALEAFQSALEILRGAADAADDRARVCAKATRMITEKAGTFRVQPDPQTAEDLLNEGLASARDPETRAWLLALNGPSLNYWRGFAGEDPVPLQQRIRKTEEGLTLAESLGNAELMSFAARGLSELYVAAFSFDRAVETARRQLTVVDRIDSAGERALLLFEVAQSMIDLASDYKEGLTLASRSYEIAKSLSAHELMHATFSQMEALYHLGRWTELEPFLEEHLAVYEQEAHVLCFAVRGGPFVGALAAANRGDAERARALATLGRGAPDKRRLLLECLYGEILALTGDPRAGIQIAEAAMSMPGRGTSADFWYRPVVAILETVALLGDWEQLAERVEWARRFERIPYMGALLAQVEGMAESKSGDRDRADGLFRKALAEFDKLGVPLEAARTREWLAGVVGGDEARSLVREALSTYESLGAKPHAERVRATLA